MKLIKIVLIGVLIVIAEDLAGQIPMGIDTAKVNLVPAGDMMEVFNKIKSASCATENEIFHLNAMGPVTQKEIAGVLPATIENLYTDSETKKWSGRLEISYTGIELTTTEFGTMQFDITAHYSNNVWTRLDIKKGKAKGTLQYAGCSYNFVMEEGSGLPSDYWMHNGNCKTDDENE